MRFSPALGIRAMLKIVPSPAPYIRIRASGRLGASDYDRFEPGIEDERRTVRRRAPKEESS
jgi:hypothetical protein